MQSQPFKLVCFAVKEEVQCFTPVDGVRVLVTGMGKENSEAKFRELLKTARPSLVLTCGFAGGLSPNLAKGTVIFSADSGLGEQLVAAGAKSARFHCADRVATTAKEKRQLAEATGADAVEMESEIIRAICAENSIPSATVRVILDTASENLPLDFNALMTASKKMNFLKLAVALLKSPGKIPALMELQKQSRAAAMNLAQVLDKVTRQPGK
jgi:nucleoside phosphorylase